MVGSPRAVGVVTQLAATVETFRAWLHLDDLAPLYAVAATVVGNRADGDPLWLLVVAPPSSGKTETLQPLAGLPYVHPVATLTEPALLSGTSSKDTTKGATGGVLRQVGEFGILLCKDFTSILAQNKDTRSHVLAALREIYDGSWDRAVGTDGARVLHWQGKCGLIGGVTPTLDKYHAVISQLGDRFLLLRLPEVDPQQSGRMALAHVGREGQMRAELAAAMTALVADADLSRVARSLDTDEQQRLVDLATFTARARTGVDRDGYTGELLVIPEVEGPGRLISALRQMLGGLEAIGCDTSTAWAVVGRIAVDCMPAIRTALVRVLLAADAPMRTSEVAAAVGMVTKTAHRHLEDLALLGLADRSKTSGADNAPDLWTPSPWLTRHWPKSRTEILPSSAEEIVVTESLSHFEGDASTECELCGQALLIHRPGRSVCERCRLSAVAS